LRVAVYVAGHRNRDAAHYRRSRGIFSMMLRSIGVFIFRIFGAFIMVRAGSFMNEIAMSANGGKMPYWADWPVKVPEDVEHIHETTKEMNLWALCDVIFGVISIGDIFIFIACWVVGYAVVDCIEKSWKWVFP
jgi:Family of unknown function (DUF5317)